MSYKAENAVIMAAGLSSRFAPLSYEKPKALIKVRGEILIERQIRQLHEAGIKEVVVVAGYKKEQFQYLEKKLGVKVIENKEYLIKNNNSSVYAAKDYLRNTYICSADNYFPENPFEPEVEESYYSVLYAEGKTNEWCVKEDEKGRITFVTIGGQDSWYMLGHTFWSEVFSQKFVSILEKEYNRPETANKMWENIYIDHINELVMKTRKYRHKEIYEFDSLDELREFDESYKTHSGSEIMENLAVRLGCREGQIYDIRPVKNSVGVVEGICFQGPEGQYEYYYETEELKQKSQNTDRLIK